MHFSGHVKQHNQILLCKNIFSCVSMGKTVLVSCVLLSALPSGNWEMHTTTITHENQLILLFIEPICIVYSHLASPRVLNLIFPLSKYINHVNIHILTIPFIRFPLIGQMRAFFSVVQFISSVIIQIYTENQFFTYKVEEKVNGKNGSRSYTFFSVISDSI